MPLRCANVAMCHCWPLPRQRPVVLRQRQPQRRRVAVARVQLLRHVIDAHDVQRLRNGSARADAGVADDWRYVVLKVACYVRR